MSKKMLRHVRIAAFRTIASHGLTTWKRRYRLRIAILCWRPHIENFLCKGENSCFLKLTQARTMWKWCRRNWNESSEIAAFVFVRVRKRDTFHQSHCLSHRYTNCQNSTFRLCIINRENDWLTSSPPPFFFRSLCDQEFFLISTKSATTNYRTKSSDSRPSAEDSSQGNKFRNWK